MSNYNNWSFKEVITHISKWRILSSQKLQSVRSNQYVLFHEDINAINGENYGKHKNELVYKNSKI